MPTVRGLSQLPTRVDVEQANSDRLRYGRLIPPARGQLAVNALRAPRLAQFRRRDLLASLLVSAEDTTAK